MRFPRRVLATPGIVVAAIVGAVYYLGFDQRLTIERTQTGVVLDAGALGEYSANAMQITLTDVQSQQVVWHIKAKHETFPIRKIALGAGANSANPDRSDEIDVVIPASSVFFELTQGREYEFVLRSLVDFGKAQTRQRFTLPDVSAQRAVPPDVRKDVPR